MEQQLKDYCKDLELTLNILIDSHSKISNELINLDLRDRMIDIKLKKLDRELVRIETKTEILSDVLHRLKSILGDLGTVEIIV